MAAARVHRIKPRTSASRACSTSAAFLSTDCCVISLGAAALPGAGVSLVGLPNGSGGPGGACRAPSACRIPPAGCHARESIAETLAGAQRRGWKRLPASARSCI